MRPVRGSYARVGRASDMCLDSGLSCVRSRLELLIVPNTVGAVAAREPVKSALARVGPGLGSEPQSVQLFACARN